MTIGPSDILSALQNGVQAIRDLGTVLKSDFLEQGAITTITSTAAGATFNASQAVAVLSVVTSTGGFYKLPLFGGP